MEDSAIVGGGLGGELTLLLDASPVGELTGHFVPGVCCAAGVWELTVMRESLPILLTTKFRQLAAR